MSKEREQRVRGQTADLFERLAQQESLGPDLRQMYAEQVEKLRGPSDRDSTPD